MSKSRHAYWQLEVERLRRMIRREREGVEWSRAHLEEMKRRAAKPGQRELWSADVSRARRELKKQLAAHERAKLALEYVKAIVNEAKRG